jgi:hypothetical protein
MPLYYFSLDDQVWPTQDGELLADDAAAKVLATQIEADLNRNRNDSDDLRQVRIFNQDRQRIG